MRPSAGGGCAILVAQRKRRGCQQPTESVWVALGMLSTQVRRRLHARQRAGAIAQDGDAPISLTWVSIWPAAAFGPRRAVDPLQAPAKFDQLKPASQKALLADISAPRFAKRDLWNIRAFPASVRLDAGELDHLAPLLGFLSDQLAEVSGRTRKHRATEVSEPRFDVGIGEAGIDLLVELVDDFGGRVFGRADPVPNTCLVARHELTDGRNIGQRVPARRGGYRQRAEPTSPDILNRCDSGAEVDLHLPSDEIGE